MLLTEYNEAETMKLFQKESYNQGKEDGKIYMLVSLVKDAVITISEAAKRLNVSEADFQKLMEAQQS